MTVTNDYSLALRAQQEIEAETGIATTSPIVPELPILDDVLARLSPLPGEGIFFGLASDGLPILLNVFDPTPGSILILGDAGAGKTNFLRMTAIVSAISHSNPVADFVVISPNVSEWAGIAMQRNCMGVWDSYDAKLGDLLFDLTQRAQKAGNRHPVLVLIDDLSQLGHLDREVVEMLYWLLHNGPAGRVWPLVTLNARYVRELPNWTTAFPTRIFGHVHDAEMGHEIARFPGVNLGTLVPGTQFCMRENGAWLRFWLPIDS